MFVDIYAIQNVPPSNINRDDTGSPKTAYYGGVLRARVSSQAWKRAIRREFVNTLSKDNLGVRTKLAVALIADRIVKNADVSQERAEELASAVILATGLKVKASDRAGSQTGKPVTEYLIFIAESELNKLADIAIRWNADNEDISKPSATMKKEVLGVFHGVQAIDIALFGRMLADAPNLNEDASAQVAHAISVDKVTQEYDYFTAVDDCADEDNAGAAMIDTVSFNSSTLYRYATVNVNALEQQLKDKEATAQGVVAFVEAFVRSMPTGKQNTFANRTLPSSIVVAIRKDQPINMVTAFEDPVQAKPGESVSELAAERLGTKIFEYEHAFDEKSIQAWNTVAGDPVEALDAVSNPSTLSSLKTQLHDSLLSELELGE